MTMAGRMTAKRRLILVGLVGLLALGLGVAAFLTGKLPGTKEPSGQITFMDREGRLYLAPASGGEIADLEMGLEWHGTPALSPPDGQGATRLVYAREMREGTIHLFVRTLGRSDDRQLTHQGQSNLVPRWSPDGSRIAFMSDRTCVYRGEGGTFQLDAPSQIFVMAADGLEQQCVTRGRSISLFPSWSPDGARIAYMGTDGGNEDIYVVDLETSEARNLTQDPARDSSPAWSPDGSCIAFMSDRSGSQDLWLMSPDGENLRQLTETPEASESEPVWSPRGDWLAFTSDRGEATETQIFILHVKSGEVRQLTQAGTAYLQPQWGP